MKVIEITFAKSHYKDMTDALAANDPNWRFYNLLARTYLTGERQARVQALNLDYMRRCIEDGTGHEHSAVTVVANEKAAMMMRLSYIDVEIHNFPADGVEEIA